MPFEKIAVALDGSENSNIALMEAIHLAKQINADLCIIHILDGFVDYDLANSFNYDEYIESKKQAAEEILTRATKVAYDHHVKSEIHLIENLYDPKRISERLANAVENTKADILVMGTHGHRGFNAFFLGSVAEETIRIASAPVLLIGIKAQTKKPAHYQKIAAAVDGSETSKTALKEAVNLAKILQSKLALIHVVNEFPCHLPLGFHLAEEQDHLKKQGQAMLDRLSAFSNEHGIIVEKYLVEIKTESKTVSKALVEELPKLKADLLIMGTHGWKGFNRFMLGSVAAETTLTSPIPMLIVRFNEEKQEK